MSAWRDIKTAPKGTGAKFDVWAKRWDATKDAFEYRRFPDVWRNGAGQIFGAHNDHDTRGWGPTHWMPLPEPPQ